MFLVSNLFLKSCYVLVDGDPKIRIVIELRPKDKKLVEQISKEFINMLDEFKNIPVPANANALFKEENLQKQLKNKSNKK